MYSRVHYLIIQPYHPPTPSTHPIHPPYSTHSSIPPLIPISYCCNGLEISVTKRSYR